MSFRALICDLDGTLLDSLADLADSCNQVLTGAGLPTHPTDAYRYFIGDGIATLVERTLPPHMAGTRAVEEYVALTLKEYAGRWHHKTKPYDGILEMLAEMTRRGVRLAVLSNKPHQATVQMVAHFFPQIPFEQVAGAKPEVAIKPDPEGVLLVASQMGLEPEDCWYLGDTGIDIRTARAAGMYAVGAAWGFRPRDLGPAGAQLIAQTPRQLLPA